MDFKRLASGLCDSHQEEEELNAFHSAVKSVFSLADSEEFIKRIVRKEVYKILKEVK